MVYLLLAVTPTAVVATFITLADGVIYGENIPRLFGIEAIEDQKIGGLIMWLPVNAIFLGTLAVPFSNGHTNKLSTQENILLIFSLIKYSFSDTSISEIVSLV